MKLKRGRYWVFAFNRDNAKGGLIDLKFSFNTVEQFEEAILSLEESYDVYQILDTQTRFDFQGDIGTITKWVCKNIGGETYEEDIY